MSQKPLDDSERKFRFRLLALGLIFILISIIMFDFFTNLRYPPERNLPIDLQPAWVKDPDLEATMNFWGDIGILFSWIIILIGLGLTVYGSLYRFRARIPRKFDSGFIESFNRVIKTDKNFLFLVISTFIFAILYFFNLLTYPPSGPLYFLRKVFLEQNAPVGFPEEALPSLSTYGTFAVIQDTVILLIYLWVIYVRVRPGRQFGEDFVNLAMERSLFLGVLMTTSIVHAIGHMPFELYGKGQWGTGYSTIESWIAFDKILHMFASMAIAMLLFMVVTRQFEKYGAETTSSHLFALAVAIAFMISLGLLWEIYEWILNFVFVLGHYEDEILDAPKDLVADLVGATIGAVLAFIELQHEKRKTNQVG
ncbi:MAG: hypothetical protein ACTSPG_02195 [Candidatus Hodarchaeales archaeon]